MLFFNTIRRHFRIGSIASVERCRHVGFTPDFGRIAARQRTDASGQKVTSSARTNNEGALATFFEIDLSRTTKPALGSWFADFSFSLPAIQD